MSSLHRDPRGKSPYWYCAYRLADGTRAFRSTKQTSRKEAERVCREFEALEDQILRGSPTEAQIRKVMGDAIARVTGRKFYDPSTEQWLADWLKRQEGAISDSSIERYSQVVRDFCACLGTRARMRLSTLTADDIAKYQTQLKAEGRSAQTVNITIKKVLKHALRIAVEEGLLDRNPVATIKPLRGTIAEKAVFTPEQVRLLVEAAEGDWKGLILAGYYTGARLSDLAHLKWSNVDLSEDKDGPKGTITFYQQKTGGKMGAKSKVVTPIHPELHEHLVASAGLDNPNAPVFPELYDKPGPGKSGLSMGFKRIMERAGIDAGLIRTAEGKKGRNLSALSFHSLRRSFNSAMANANVSQELRMKLTGHSSIDINAGYTRFEMETLRRAIGSISRLPKGTDE
jgi:integrase